jgi:hypothetical protein
MALPISPASTAHSIPLEYENAPTGKDGDSQVISRYSAAASPSFMAYRSSIGCAALSLTVPVRTTARRRGLAGALFVVMSTGMAVMLVMIAMLIVVVIVMAMTVTAMLVR